MQDRLFAATGDHLKLVVFDRVNASRVLAAYNVDARLNNIAVINDVGDPTHGKAAKPFCLLGVVKATRLHVKTMLPGIF